MDESEESILLSQSICLIYYCQDIVSLGKYGKLLYKQKLITEPSG